MSLKEKFKSWVTYLLEEPVGSAARPVWLQVYPGQIRPHVRYEISENPKTLEARQDAKTGLWDIHLTSLENVGRDFRINVSGEHRVCDWGTVWGGLSTDEMIEKLQPFTGDREEDDPAFFPNFAAACRREDQCPAPAQGDTPRLAR